MGRLERRGATDVTLTPELPAPDFNAFRVFRKRGASLEGAGGEQHFRDAARVGRVRQTTQCTQARSCRHFTRVFDHPPERRLGKAPATQVRPYRGAAWQAESHAGPGQLGHQTEALQGHLVSEACCDVPACARVLERGVEGEHHDAGRWGDTKSDGGHQQ